jgi:subfamily B ATP-binding cassette protein MsbA
VPIVIVAVTSLKAAAQFGQAVAIQSVVLRVIEGLQNSLFRALTRADLATVAREAPARHAARFTTDAALIREALTKSISAVADALTLVGLVISMVWLDWQMSLVGGLLYPIAVLPILKLGKRIRRASGGMQERVGEAAATLTESFGAARVVRAYRLEGAEEARAAGLFARLRDSLYGIARTRASLDPMLESLGGLAVAAVLVFVGWRVSSGTGTVGEFTGFVAALLIASRPARALGSLNAALQEGLAGLARVYAVIDEKRRIVDAPDAVALPPGHGRIAFAGVGFTYDGVPDAALTGLTFAAEPGQTVALVGPSGGGKSTAIALVPRLYDPTEGWVLIDGVDTRSVTLASLRDAIAYVGQEATIFDDTAFANIGCGRPGATRAEVEEAARAAAAHDFIAALPDGYDTPLGPGGSRLSGGQRQRVSLAPRPAAQPAHPAAGRSDQRARCGERGSGAAGAGAAPRRSHHAGHRASPRHGARRRPHRGDGPGPRGRTGGPCGADGTGRTLRAARADADIRMSAPPDPGALYPVPGDTSTVLLKPLLSLFPDVTNVTAATTPTTTTMKTRCASWSAACATISASGRSRSGATAPSRIARPS